MIAPLTTESEIFNIIITTLVIGYIFSAYIPLELSFFKKGKYQQLKFAMLLSAPAIILHELGHKFASVAFGIPAYFEIWWVGIVIALFLRFVGSPFMIIAPGYVGIQGSTSDVSMMIIAFAGPLINILLYFLSGYLLKTSWIRVRKRKYIPLLMMSQKLNLWLFIFNMIPIPPLDGSKVIGGLISMVF